MSRPLSPAVLLNLLKVEAQKNLRSLPVILPKSLSLYQGQKMRNFLKVPRGFGNFRAAHRHYEAISREWERKAFKRTAKWLISGILNTNPIVFKMLQQDIEGISDPFQMA